VWKGLGGACERFEERRVTEYRYFLVTMLYPFKPSLECINTLHQLFLRLLAAGIPRVLRSAQSIRSVESVWKLPEAIQHYDGDVLICLHDNMRGVLCAAQW
jgi:hypothetical protein